MDTAVAAADAAVMAVLNEFAPPGDPTETVDKVLRPFVTAIATELRDGDWDCIEESEYFGRFRQEMLGYDHRRMAEWYRERLTEDYDPTPDEVREYGALLAHHLEELDNGR